LHDDFHRHGGWGGFHVTAGLQTEGNGKERK